MTASWTLTVARDDLSDTELTDGTVPELADGEALLRVERVGVTANNVTYAVLGDAMRYWQFFPAAAPDRGIVPLWGFAEVIESTVAGVTPGDRYYGYYPSASHLVVQPGRVDERGFRDLSPHRAQLPSPYNAYALTTGDVSYEADREDLQILYRPLFYTSFMLADKVVDNSFFGASTVVLSSASSKTAYGAAFLLHGQGARIVGLTSPANVEFTESLGCYDTVLPYSGLRELDPTAPTAYLDLAGSADLRAALLTHLGDQLVYDAVVGETHQEQAGPSAFAGGGKIFFAPDQMRKRKEDWGRDGLDRNYAQAWHRFAPKVSSWVDVVVSQGPKALREVWLDVLSGHSAPRVGNVIEL